MSSFNVFTAMISHTNSVSQRIEKVVIWDPLGDVSGKLFQSSGDMSRAKKNSQEVMHPLRIISGVHKQAIEDVRWHARDPNLFCSVGDDRLLAFYDKRLKGNAVTHRVAKLHENDINSVSWNPLDSHYVATGSSDGNVKIIDCRLLATADKEVELSTSSRHIHTSHTCVTRTLYCTENTEVDRVSWSPHSSSHIMVNLREEPLQIWDVCSAHLESQPPPSSSRARPKGVKKMKDIRNGVVFENQAYKGSVTCTAWCPSVPWLIATCYHADTGGGISIWRPNDFVYCSPTQVSSFLSQVFL